MKLHQFFIAVNLLAGYFAWNTPNCQQGTVIVHLFNWKWTDIAAECERFLGPRGYCGVQVSPPNEHVVVYAPDRPWWERYQPVSYNLNSRSGNDAQFRDMVNRCNAVGVNIYVDVVINHMTGSTMSGTGSGGCSYDAAIGHFPCVPYSSGDFNGCDGVCSDNGCSIDNYHDANEVRNCRLVSLMDLALGKDYVRGKVRDYLQDLLDLGVKGFRIDACKHMWPGDIQQILNGLNGNPFIYNEVIDLCGEPIVATEYTHLGRVTEFKYSKAIGNTFQRNDILAHTYNLGRGWGFLPDGDALVFVDNHDNQRDGGNDILNHNKPKEYKMANAFMLAWPYGFPRVMSSYYFGSRDEGPPKNEDGSIKDVPVYADNTCGDGWVCEHRWRQIYNMVEFRNVVDGTGVEHWWDNGFHQIAFARGNKGFIAINNEDYDLNLNNHYIGLPDGSYCDVISGSLVNGACTGYQLTVSNGRISLWIPPHNEDPMMAIHECSRIGSTCAYKRTVVLLHKPTIGGQFVFFRGGNVHGCTAETCPVGIEQNVLGTGSHYDSYNAWGVGDNQLDWYPNGPESGQGTYNGMQALGTPSAWTTNVPGANGYQSLNTFGEHYWMMDVNMNCDETEDGWFHLKAYMNGWESDIDQGACTGTSGGSAPSTTNNHVAKCGKVNVFYWESGFCNITDF